MRASLLLLLASCSVEVASPREALCGWVETGRSNLPHAEHCWRARIGHNAAVTELGRDPCDVDHSDSELARPGDSRALWARLAAADGVHVSWRVDSCVE